MSKYCSEFVVWPYYYPFEDVPYFESKMISCHNKYNPSKREKLTRTKLDDGTYIETFDGSNVLLLLALVLIIIFLLL